MKKRLLLGLAVGLAMFGMIGVASATTFTMQSPTAEGTLSSGVTQIGGLVLDLIGTNGNRVVSQLAASSLYQGYFDFYTNPGNIGTQYGFDTTVTNALGGGIAELALRLTVYDGDTAFGNFDWNDNSLLLNGLDFGNFSAVTTERTDATGTISYSNQLGFQDNGTNTGFFYSNNTTNLSNFYNSLINTTLVNFQLRDVDPYDNYFDFKAGVDGSLWNVGTGPVVTPPSSVPEPTTMLLFGVGLLGLAGVNRKKLNK